MLIIGLIALALVFIGTIMLVFMKGKRWVGAIVATVAMCTVIAVGGRLETPAGTTVQSENATLSGRATAIVSDAVSTEYGTALAPYCEMHERYTKSIREADVAFGVEGSDAKLAWIRDKELRSIEQFEQIVGEPISSFRAVASAQEWAQRCEGRQRGWALVEHSDAMAATSDDARKAMSALEAFYESKLPMRSPATNTEYLRSRCKSDVVSGFRIIGCTLIGGTFLQKLTSPTYMFIAGRNGDTAMYAPLDSEAKSILNGYRNSDKSAAVLGWYVGPYPIPIDWEQAEQKLSQ